MLKKMVQQKVSIRQMSSPIGMAPVLGDQSGAEAGSRFSS